MVSSFFATISSFLAALHFTSVGTSPPPGIPELVLKIQAISVLSPADISSITPFTQFARAAYCQPSKIHNWSCGQACSALPGFQPALTGGDDNDIPYFFVGYWPQQNSVIVSHQGTNPQELLSLRDDAEIGKVAPSSRLFPGIPGGVLVHDGFRDTHNATASTILTQVKQLIGSRGATSVVAVGHSLGGAIAELDTVYLRLNLPSSVTVKGVTYGTPRVGNPAWASWFDSKVNGNFRRINHELDPIPIVPGRGLGFRHVAGEIHIEGPDWNSCSGNDNTEIGCTISEVPDILVSDINDHSGPYGGVYIGSDFCN